jgi:hypothetical protein
MILFPFLAHFSHNVFQVNENAVLKMYLFADAVAKRIVLLSQPPSPSSSIKNAVYQESYLFCLGGSDEE